MTYTCGIVTGYKSKYKNVWLFYTAVINVDNKMRKTIPFTRASNKFHSALLGGSPEFKLQFHSLRKISLE
jgi:hypothetical protein